MDKLIPDKMRLLLEKILPDWEQRLGKARRSLKNWRQALLDISLKTMIFAVCSWLAYAVLLHFLKSLWFVYMSTPVGYTFTDTVSALTARRISGILSGNLFDLSLLATANALFTCLTIGIISQLLLIRRYLFVGRGMVNRLLWCLLCTAATAYDAAGVNFAAGIDFVTGLYVYLLPCLALFTICFTLAAKMVPELDIAALVRSIVKHIKFIRIRNRLIRQDEN